MSKTTLHTSAALETITARLHRAFSPGGPRRAHCREWNLSLFSAERLERRLFLSAVTFGPVQTHAVGSDPISSAVADLGNGHPDVVVGNHGDNTVSVLIGNGDGTFQPQKTYATGSGPLSLTIADLGNGHPDVVVLDGGGVSVLLGNGDGTFQPQKTYAAGDTPQSLTVADLGNGHPDLVVLDNGSVSVLLGNGDGTFQPPTTVSVSGASSLTVANLGNGHPDLIVASSENTVDVLLGNGDGTFQPQTTYATGMAPVSVAVADLGNGHPDLVVANQGDNTVGVLLGNGDGTFQAQKTYAAGDGPTSLAVADLGNGHPDIVVANTFGTNGFTMSVLLGNGDGTFQSQESYATGTSPSFVAVVAELGSGHPDVVVTTLSGLPVFLGNGDGTLQAPETYAGGAGFGGVADLGNGHPDIITIDPILNVVDVLLGTGVVPPPTTTLTSSANPTASGAAVTLTATVTSPGGIPTGTVSFFDGTTLLGAPVTLSNGVATLTISSLPAGPDALTADYSGDLIYPTSSASLSEAVTDLSAALGGSVPASVVAGTPLKGNETLTLTPAAGAGTGVGSALILLSPDESSADAVLTLSSAKALKFKVGKADHVKLKLPKSVPASVPGGTYHVLIKLTDTTGAVATLDSGQTITVVAPAVDLTGSFVKAPATAVAGKKFKATFLVTNTSAANVSAFGTLPIDVESSPDGLLSDGTVLTVLKPRVNLKPGKSEKITVTATLGASAFLVVNLDPGNAVFPDDLNPANNVFHSLSAIQVG